jgi:DMSO/TMAO reductase YedYZ molybdopterin-dependent catalytic subunit
MTDQSGATTGSNERIVRSADPLNLETPFSSLDGFITPTKSFYVRTHFPLPSIDRGNWRLRVEGEVNHPFEIDYRELVSLPSQSAPVTLECAGNNRSFLEPKVKGVQWELGAVGNAEWAGVPLAALLNRAEPKRGALEVILEGADNGEIAENKAPAGAIQFARSIPLAKALDDILLAYRMNGEELLPEHGFPLRAIVPGWYAMASVKWLQRIIVTDRPFNGYYQTLDYAYWRRRGEHSELTPLGPMVLKAEIAQPANGSTVTAGSTFRIHGAAWGGKVKDVEVSVDGGSSWRRANLIDESRGTAWCRWELDWVVPSRPAKQILMARAIGEDGGTQPTQRDADLGTYMIHHILAIEVEVV